MAEWNPNWAPSGRRQFHAGGGAPAYTAPLDLVPELLGGYSLRALSAAHLGENVCRLKRDSDDAEMDFACDADDGEFPTAAAVAWRDAEGAANAYLVIYYGQGSAPDLDTPVVNTVLPLFVENYLNGKPGFRNDDVGAASHLLSTTEASLVGGAFSMFCVVKLTTNNGIIGTFDTGTPYSSMYLKTGIGDNSYVDADAGDNSAGGDTSGITFSGDFTALGASWQFGERIFYYNGAPQTIDDAYDAGGVVPTVSRVLQMYMDAGAVDNNCEWLIGATYVSAANIVAIQSNQSAYFS